MKERPILFSGPMVRAILDNRKTQSRRVVKNAHGAFWDHAGYKPRVSKLGFVVWFKVETNEYIPYAPMPTCPYGTIGDRLWVREKWAHDDPDCADVKCGNIDHIWWYASENKIVADSFAGKAHWRPSIHMPRWASRITLEIVKIRSERLHAITTADILAEGIKQTKDEFWLGPLAGVPDYPWGRAELAYASLWNELNDKRGHGWDDNPFVWVIEFKRVDVC